ncbi:hypothetical protein SCG7086_CE_00050 [Chlamydiales bacterium SCGC AG-110-P3]|nr:hypothetical protein SCG7086_CE_00050 [Chlamydiales bacterium SCGC AG-110-P3]
MHYILVHGSWHGALCWEKVAPFLEQKSHTVECVDLPGYEKVATPAQVTYQDYYDHIEEILLQV